jgi:hypothetical protein
MSIARPTGLVSERKERELNQQLTRRVGELENEVQRLHEEMSQLRIEILGRDYTRPKSGGISSYFQSLKISLPESSRKPRQPGRISSYKDGRFATIMAALTHLPWHS